MGDVPYANKTTTASWRARRVGVLEDVPRPLVQAMSRLGNGLYAAKQHEDALTVSPLRSGASEA